MAATARGLAVLALLMALALSAWRVVLDGRQRELSSDAALLRQQLSAAQAESVVKTAEPDFAVRLHEALAVDPVVRELQRSSTAWGSAFVAVSSASHAATAQTLGREELAITLRGAYPQLKAVLSDALDRFPDLVVQRLRFRRLAAPADLEAHADLVLVSRPRLASGAGR
jgi:Tfp pilus assembly protein FimT